MNPVAEHVSNIAAFTTENAMLSEATYYGMGGCARYLCTPRSLSEVRAAIAFARGSALPLAVLGSGSNAVCSDEPFAGVVLSLASLRRWHWLGPNRLLCEAGVTNTEVAEICLAQNVPGAHWMYRMPGLVGASIRMNARCYGGEVSQVVESVTTVDVTGAMHTYSAAEVFKGYKSTSLMERPEIVVSCVFQFKDPSAHLFGDILSRMESCERDRHGKHHFDFPSCGSTFKNNYAVGKPSGRVFDELGLKGLQVGNVAVSMHHANFLWNLGKARALDMLTLAGTMRARALAAGADLELEVQPIGLFSSTLYDTCAMERLGPAFDHTPSAKSAAGFEAEDIQTPLANKTKQKWVGLTWHPDAAARPQGIPFVPHSEPHNTVPAPTGPLNRELFHLVPEEYFRAPHAGPSGLTVRLVQVCSVAHAQKHPNAPFLRWETHVQESELQRLFPLIPSSEGGFLDALWTYSVSELFLAHPSWREATDPRMQSAHTAPYLEFEITPQLHWIALAFEGRRRRTAESTQANEALWTGVERFLERSSVPEENATAQETPQGTARVIFGMSLPWRVVAPCVEIFATTANSSACHSNAGGGLLRAQAAFSLGGSRYFLAPHWSMLGDNETHCLGTHPTQPPDFHQPFRYEAFVLF